MNTKLQSTPDTRPASISRILEQTRDSRELRLLKLAFPPGKSNRNHNSFGEQNLGNKLKEKLESLLFNDCQEPDLFAGQFAGPDEVLLGTWARNFLNMVSPGQLPRFRSKDFLIYPERYSVSAGLWLPSSHNGKLGFIPCITQIENEYMQELPDKIFNLVARYLVIRDSKDIPAIPRGVLAIFRANGEVTLNEICLSDYTEQFWQRINQYPQSSSQN